MRKRMNQNTSGVGTEWTRGSGGSSGRV